MGIIASLTQIDDKTIGSGKPGALTQRLMSYQEQVVKVT
jgi:hypothetical protein